MTKNSDVSSCRQRKQNIFRGTAGKTIELFVWSKKEIHQLSKIGGQYKPKKTRRGVPAKKTGHRKMKDGVVGFLKKRRFPKIIKAG